MTRVLFPREHGAYGQVSLPLVTAFGVAGFSAAGVLLSAAVVAGFLAHEPAAIVLGLRGARAQRELWQPALRALVVSVILGCAAAVAATLVMEAAVRGSLLVPAVPAVLLAVAMIAGREKSWYGEVLAALSFAGVAVPVVLAAGTSFDTAMAVAIPFAVLFIASTLAVRVVILRVRGGGDPYAATMTRLATLLVTTASTLLIAVMLVAGWVVPSVLIASAPGLLIASVVAVRPPSPTRLRSLGWSLVGVSVLTAVIIVAAARVR